MIKLAVCLILGVLATLALYKFNWDTHGSLSLVPFPYLPLAFNVYRAFREWERRENLEQEIADLRQEFMAASHGILTVFMPSAKRTEWESVVASVCLSRAEVMGVGQQGNRPSQESYEQAMARLAKELETEEARTAVTVHARTRWHNLVGEWIHELGKELPGLITQALPPDSDQRPMTRWLRDELLEDQRRLPAFLGEARVRQSKGQCHQDRWEQMLAFIGQVRFHILAAQDLPAV